MSISGISRWGLTRDLFAVGDRLRVAGNPARRNASNLFVRNILLPGGREIVLGGAARWSSDTLRGSELLQAREGDASRPELGLFRTWSTGGVNGVLFPEAVQANFDFSRYPLTPAARAALEQFDFETDDPTVDCAPKGMPTIMEQPYPMEIVDRGDTIELLIEEYDTRRVVHMRGPALRRRNGSAEPARLLRRPVRRCDARRHDDEVELGPFRQRRHSAFGRRRARGALHAVRGRRSRSTTCSRSRMPRRSRRPSSSRRRGSGAPRSRAARTSAGASTGLRASRRRRARPARCRRRRRLRLPRRCRRSRRRRRGSRRSRRGSARRRSAAGTCRRPSRPA